MASVENDIVNLDISLAEWLLPRLHAWRELHSERFVEDEDTARAWEAGVRACEYILQEGVLWPFDSAGASAREDFMHFAGEISRFWL